MSLDATNLKAREAGRVVSAAAIVAVGTNGAGRREILDLAIGASEAEACWTVFPRSLARRGQRWVKLIISDSHGSIRASVSRLFRST